MSMGQMGALILQAMGGPVLKCSVCEKEFTRARAPCVLDENNKSLTAKDIRSARGVLRYECPRCGDFQPGS